MAEKLIYDARNLDEQRRNQARLGEYYQQRERSWDERVGFVRPALPLLPLVATAAMILGVFVLLFLLSGCASYTRWLSTELVGCEPVAYERGVCVQRTAQKGKP